MLLVALLLTSPICLLSRQNNDLCKKNVPTPAISLIHKEFRAGYPFFLRNPKLFLDGNVSNEATYVELRAPLTFVFISPFSYFLPEMKWLNIPIFLLAIDLPYSAVRLPSVG